MNFHEQGYPVCSVQLFGRSNVTINLNFQVALTTDGWTSRATESFVTVTSTHVSNDWELKNYTLQTHTLPESHTG